MEKYLDNQPDTGGTGKDLLAKMSLEEKMAQTQSMFPPGTRREIGVRPRGRPAGTVSAASPRWKCGR